MFLILISTSVIVIGIVCVMDITANFHYSSPEFFCTGVKNIFCGPVILGHVRVRVIYIKRRMNIEFVTLL